jgi:hypothetical protein
MTNLSEAQCRAIFEAARWPNGPVCPKCGATRQASRLSTRPGLYACKACRNCQYSVTSGTPLHGTRVTLAHWTRLIETKSVKGIDRTISRIALDLDVSYLTARSMIERAEQLKASNPAMFERLVDGIRDQKNREAA